MPNSKTLAPTLFDHYDLAGRTLANRAVMAPMTRARAPGHIPTSEMARYYRQRAGAGLVITEGTPISQEGNGFADCPGIWSAEQVKAWGGVTAAVHDQGGTIFTQIWHVGRISHTRLQPDNLAPVSATNKRAETSSAFLRDSAGKAGFHLASEPRALRTEEVARVVKDFARAATNAAEAGFDGVEIHGANGYLVEQFLNGAVNDRSDRYGGSIENRVRFALEVVDALALSESARSTLAFGFRLSAGCTIWGIFQTRQPCSCTSDVNSVVATSHTCT